MKIETEIGKMGVKKNCCRKTEKLRQSKENRKLGKEIMSGWKD